MGVLTTALAARAYGPAVLGNITYAVAYTSLFIPFAKLGLDTILIHEFVTNTRRLSNVLATALGLRLLGSFTAMIAIWLSAGFTTGPDGSNKWLLILSFSSVIAIAEVFLCWLQANGMIVLGAVARIIGYLVTTVARLLILLTNAPALWYAATYVLDSILALITLSIAYIVASRHVRMGHFRVSIAKHLLKRGWPLVASSLAVALYSRVDQVMIGSILNDPRSTGLYAAAVTMAELWYFVPLAVITALQPGFFRTPSDSAASKIATQRIYDLVAAISLSACLGLTVLGWPAMRLMFGVQYMTQETYTSFIILLWAGLLAMLGSARGPWLIACDLQRFSVIYLVGGCLVNIALNWFMIPMYGIVGAAISTAVAQLFVVIIIPAAIRPTRPSVSHILLAFHPIHLGVSVMLAAKVLMRKSLKG